MLKKDNDIEHLVKRFMDSNLHDAWDAGLRLKDAGTRSISPLIDGLESDDLNTRWRSAILLSEFGEDAVEPLISSAQNGEARSAIAAFWALGKIADPRACDLLIQATAHENCMVRSTAVEALGAFGTEQARDAVLAALSDEDEYVRWHAEDALHRILLG